MRSREVFCGLRIDGRFIWEYGRFSLCGGCWWASVYTVDGFSCPFISYFRCPCSIENSESKMEARWWHPCTPLLNSSFPLFPSLTWFLFLSLSSFFFLFLLSVCLSPLTVTNQACREKYTVLKQTHSSHAFSSYRKVMFSLLLILVFLLVTNRTKKKTHRQIMMPAHRTIKHYVTLPPFFITLQQWCIFLYHATLTHLRTLQYTFLCHTVNLQHYRTFTLPASYWHLLLVPYNTHT